MNKTLKTLVGAGLIGIVLITLSGCATSSYFHAVSDSPVGATLYPQGLAEDDYIRFVASHDTKFLGVDLYAVSPISWGLNPLFRKCYAMTTGQGCTRHFSLAKTVILERPIAGMQTATLSSRWDDPTNYGSLEVEEPNNRTHDNAFDFEAERHWVLAVMQEIHDITRIDMTLLENSEPGVSAYGESDVFAVCVSSFPCKSNRTTYDMNGTKEESLEITSHKIVISPLYWCEHRATLKSGN